MKTRKKSIQREKILDFISRTNTHPTANQIFEKLRPEIPKLSLGNLYRNIRILMEEGRLRSRDFGDGAEHFDAVTTPHYHFVCEHCKSIFDLRFPVQDSINRLAGEQSDHLIAGHSVHFYGICSECRKSEKKEDNDGKEEKTD